MKEEGNLIYLELKDCKNCIHLDSKNHCNRFDEDVKEGELFLCGAFEQKEINTKENNNKNKKIFEFY